ncbi:MAG: LysR family transcriptional regulator [Anaerovoracaceae bacterium]
MNFHQLEHVVAIADSGSISAAAKRLYMGQPNLSKSIKDLEGETGMKLFRRTAKGVEPTPQGVIFIEHAKNVLAQLEQLEGLYQKPRGATTFNVAVPSVSYITDILVDYMSQVPTLPRRITYNETDFLTAVRLITAHEFDLAIVHLEQAQMDYFSKLAEEHHFRYEKLHSYPLMLTYHGKNSSTVPFTTEIVDPDIIDLPLNKLPLQLPRNSQIQANNNGNQLQFLQEISGSYMWSAPISPDVLERYGLLQKQVPGITVYNDIAIYLQTNPQLSLILDLILQLKNFQLDAFNQDK